MDYAFISLAKRGSHQKWKSLIPEITNMQKGNQTQVRGTNAMLVALTKIGAAPHMQ